MVFDAGYRARSVNLISRPVPVRTRASRGTQRPPPEGPGFRGGVTGLDAASERLAARLPAGTVTRT